MIRSDRPYDPAERARYMREHGFWHDMSFDDLLVEAVSRYPDKNAIVAYRSDAGYDRPVKTITWRELEELVSRAAGGLRGLGVGKGDIVGVMLPNWWEFVVSALAINRVGAAVNPLMHIFRHRELRFMLGFADTKAIVIPKTFNRFDFPAMLEDLRPELPALKHVIVVDGDGGSEFNRVLLESGRPPAGPNPPEKLAADEMAILMYTSGTTGEPKGVMQCHNTMIACTDSLAARAHLTSDTVIGGVTPFGHMMGYTANQVQTLRLGGTLVLTDIWSGANCTPVLAREGVTHIGAATPFLDDICRAVEAGAPKPPLKTFICGGAPIPPVVIERALDILDLPVSSLWGMTENMCGTMTEPERAREKASTTDGSAVPGVEVKVTDDDYNELPVGKTGRLLVRGSQNFLGYYKRPELENVLPGGWIDSGDLAYMDDEGYIRIDGRTKDILIRGGENVPVVEIEDILHRHPAITAAALVGYPDDRLGERGCAVVTLKEGASLTLADIQDWMAKSHAAKQYWPERLEILDVMPRTPNGKIQKNVLRERIRETVAG
ncbi:MAG: AMP-binding protein [Flavobacteriaceae bacterium]